VNPDVIPAVFVAHLPQEPGKSLHIEPIVNKEKNSHEKMHENNKTEVSNFVRLSL
jgi:hypothetical protein